MAEFGTPETWNMKVGNFIETQLPKEKPQALLDLQEQNRKQRLLESLQKIGPGLMDESLDFIKRENFAEAGFVFGNQKFNVDIPNLTPVQSKSFQKGLKDLEKWLKNPNAENWIETFRTPSKTGQTHQSEFSLNLRKYLQGQPVKARAKELFDSVDIKNLLGDTVKDIQTYTPQEFRRVSNLPKSEKAAKVAMAKSAKAANAVRDVFVKDPDADLEDVARGIFGKDFDKASVVVQEDMLSKASDDTAKLLDAISANRPVPGFKPIAADKMGDIIQNIEDNTKDFKFREGTIRDYRFRVRDSLLGIKTESKEGFRNLRNVVGGTDKGKVVDEVFGLSATFKNAPGYVENVQLIDKEINNKKGKQIDKPFSAIVNAVKNKKDIVQYEGKETNISEAIKKFNAKSKAFGKKNKISTPQILVGDNLDANKLVSNFKDYSPQAQKNILDLADEGFVLTSTKPATPVGKLAFKPGMQPDGQLKDYPGGNTKGSFGGKELAKATGEKILQALRVLGSPGVSSAIGASELAEGNIKTAGASLLLPELVSKAAPAGKGILSRAGSLLLNPYGKYARALTPVGLATIGVGMGKDVYDEYKRREALTDEERLEEDLEAQEKFDEAMIGAAEGGRIGFADGPDDPSKRKFMKLMGILSLLPYGLGKLVKPAAKVAPVVAEGVKLGFDKFMMLVNKIKELGTPTKKVTQQEREVGYTYTGKDGSEYELVEDLTTGDIRVTKDKPGFTMSGDEAFDTIEDRSTFVLKKGQADETTKGKTPPDEYDEVKEVASPDGTFDDVDEISDTAVKEVLDEID